MKSAFFSLLFTALLFCGLQNASAQRQLPSYSAKTLMQRLASKDTTYIVNFWATWCIPCIQEMPEFEALEKRYAGTAVKVLLVSLDFKEDLRFRVPSFIERKKLAPEVVWLNETDAEKFIPKIDNRWTGSIPATMLVGGEPRKQVFIERTITADEIVGMIPSAATE